MIGELRDQFQIKLIDKVSAVPTPKEIDSPFSIPHPLRPKLISVHCYLASQNGADIRMWYMPKRQLWSVDDYRSEIIQFSGCEFDGKLLDCGRFYYQADMLVEHSIWAKRNTFVKWAEELFRKTKQTLRYSKSLAAYVGHDAADWQKNGGRFGHVAPSGTIIDSGKPEWSNPR
jgi:hypothetical protein